MLDILGREINRGDVIVFGATLKSNNMRMSTTSFGVVSNILPDRTYKQGTAQYNKMMLAWGNNLSPVNLPNLPSDVTIIAKITFYQLYVTDIRLPTETNLHKNGKPKRKVIATNQFLKFDMQQLSEDYANAYVALRTAFKI